MILYHYSFGMIWRWSSIQQEIFESARVDWWYEINHWTVRRPSTTQVQMLEALNYCWIETSNTVKTWNNISAVWVEVDKSGNIRLQHFDALYTPMSSTDFCHRNVCWYERAVLYIKSQTGLSGSQSGGQEKNRIQAIFAQIHQMPKKATCSSDSVALGDNVSWMQRRKQETRNAW